MKIGILGTRGIPNQHGGFEQFVEHVAPLLVLQGHEVYVYNSSLHPFKEEKWKDVHIIRRYDPENKIGTTGQFIYDLNCVLDTRRRNYDIVLQLGYTSSSVWTFLFPSKSILVTNMDGLEWKRIKYSKPVRFFLRQAEKWAALYSDALIADSKGIQSYILEKYKKPSAFIAYGATLFEQPDESCLSKFGVKKNLYNVVLARMEPENNIETIIQGHIKANTGITLIIIGRYTNKYGKWLKSKFESPTIQFLGPIYDQDTLSNLRYYSHLYFHGHSVGGTNPSLLEAMASNALVAANQNVFNSSVLGDDAFYFCSPEDVANLLKNVRCKSDYKSFLENNRNKIKGDYSWKQIVYLLEKYLLNVAERSKRQIS